MPAIQSTRGCELMARKKDGRASWFKVFLHQKALIDSVPNENVGAALKAALQYFETGEMPQIDQLSFAVFSAFKQYIDESNDDFKKFSEAGQRGNRKRWDNHVSPPDTTQSPPDTGYHEAEALSIKHYAEAEAKGTGADKPPRSRFIPPTVEDVKQYCFDHGYTVDAERFVSYYESNGWMVGRNKMKSWQAAVRTWNGKEQPSGKTEHNHLWTVGTTV